MEAQSLPTKNKNRLKHTKFLMTLLETAPFLNQVQQLKMIYLYLVKTIEPIILVYHETIFRSTDKDQ
jgi:hypothetical protein